jgi:hypothetical protein
MKTTLVIDRLEDGWAVLEYGDAGITFNVPTALLPKGVDEGDVIELIVSMRRDETHSRRAEMEKLLEGNMDD